MDIYESSPFQHQMTLKLKHLSSFFRRFTDHNNHSNIFISPTGSFDKIILRIVNWHLTDHPPPLSLRFAGVSRAQPAVSALSHMRNRVAKSRCDPICLCCFAFVHFLWKRGAAESSPPTHLAESELPFIVPENNVKQRCNSCQDRGSSLELCIVVMAFIGLEEHVASRATGCFGDSSPWNPHHASMPRSKIPHWNNEWEF